MRFTVPDDWGYAELFVEDRIVDRIDFIDNEITYLIISDQIFEDSLEPFIDWKTEKGYNNLVKLSSKSFLQKQAATEK